MRRLVIYAALVLFISNCANAGTWTALNMPGLTDTESISLEGINTDYIVGAYRLNSDYDRYHGLLYNLKTGFLTTLDKPGVGKFGTEIRDIDANNVVGSYYDTGWHGFIYNLNTQNWITIDVPGNKSMNPYGIDGNIIVGDYSDGINSHGFIFNMTNQTYTSLDKAGAESVHPHGIRGDDIVGDYHDGSTFHGFIYNLANETWTILDAPGADETIITGIDANDIVGYYNGTSSFIYNITTHSWDSIYSPQGSDNIFPDNIGGSRIIFSHVGQYGSVYTLSGSEPVVPVCFAPVPGDANGDCKIDFADFAIMSLHWLECNLQPPSACWQ